MTLMRDNLDRSTTYTYDSCNRLLSVTDPLERTTSYAYDTWGNRTSVTDPENHTTTYQYNSYGWLTSVTDHWNRTTAYQYDSYGNLTQMTDSNNRSTYYQDYNDFGQVGKIIDAANNETLITYNAAGLKSATRDPKGNWTYFTYDKQYRLVEVEDAMNQTTSYTYDVRGNLTKFTDARGKETAYAYDAFNRMTSETDPLSKTVSYEYSNGGGGCSSCGDLGALAAKVDAKNQRTEYEYDNRGRLKKIKYPPGSDYVEFTYDANGNRLSMFDTRLNIGNETFSYQYDTLNRLTRETYPNSDYIEYTYNTEGRRATMRLPSGHTQTYSYDTRGRLSSIDHSLGNKTFCYIYNSDNTLSYTFYPNLMTNYYSYDNLYRLSSLNAKDDNQDAVYSIDYAYDANGNRTQAFWDSDTSVNTFKYKKFYTYDALNQMKSERKMNQGLTSRLYEYQYQFDAAGNRTQMKYFDGSTTTTTSYTHNNGNQLTARTVGNHEYSYSYDNNGNLTYEEDVPGPVREFTWNEDDRLTAVNRDEYGSASYVYDALGRRIVRTSGTTSTFYYYDGLTVIAEKQKVGEGNWDWQRVFTIAPGVIGNIFRISEKSGETWSDAYYHYDAIGNVVLRTNGYGSILESLDQDAYGNVKVGTQAGYHLTTKEYDSIPELYYFLQRWYDPIIGIFINKDIYRSVNSRYLYTDNDPINSIDPEGMYKIDDSCKNSGLNLNRSKDKDSECNKQADKITDVKLKKCVKKNCQKGKVKCENPCEKEAKCQIKPDPDGGANITYPLGYPGTGHAAVLCHENIKACGLNNTQDIWGIIIHEYAHDCGWHHNEGKGVPGNSGISSTSKCKTTTE